MTREEALALLQRRQEDISYDTLDEVFIVFGFTSDSPSFDTEVYYHPAFPCGRFTARDDGLHVLTDLQRGVVLGMLECVMLNEQFPH